MLKGKFKLLALPAVALGMFIGFSAFTGETESAGHTHKSCTNGDSKHCYSRDCVDEPGKPKCDKQVSECKDSWLQRNNCK